MKKLLTALTGLAVKLPAAIPDALIVLGVAAVSYGAWLLIPAAGYITGGVLMLVFGVLTALKAGK
jgi:hypothetical protein